MGADNYTICPKCKLQHEEEIKNKHAELYTGRDKMTLDEFRVAFDSIVELQRKDLENSFREDYEIGVFDGELFEINYRGSCNICKFKFDYKYNQPIEVNCDSYSVLS